MSDSAAYRLFHSKTFNTALRNFSFPADFEIRHQKIKQWITVLEKGTLDEVKEVSLHGSFLNDIFQEVLGYCSIIQGSGKAWEIHSELTISDGGGSADGAIGFFTTTEKKQGKVKLQGKVVAPIELKAARIDLDRPTPGRKETPVEQGWRYANYTPECRWIIVSNYRELRLYQTSKTPAYYERFLLSELADIEAFKRFYFLLCRNNFLPKQQDKQTISVIDELLIKSNEAKRETEIKFWETYRDEVLKKTRVIDPACGSGAFLIAAFDYLSRQYERVNEALAVLRGGQRSLFDLNKTILNTNLYGVDLSPESVEITKLSLWLKTAEVGKTLTDLDGNIKVGNSIVDDASFADKAFNWKAEFNEVFDDGGFDVVIGNPPYVRQELLSPIKPYLQENYDSYDGVADLYTYFYSIYRKIMILMTVWQICIPIFMKRV